MALSNLTNIKLCPLAQFLPSIQSHHQYSLQPATLLIFQNSDSLRIIIMKIAIGDFPAIH